jgi:hypothetical protein
MANEMSVSAIETVRPTSWTAVLKTTRCGTFTPRS